MSESPTYMSRAIRWALRCLLTYKACARRVQGRDVGSKCEFVGLRDPSEARAPGHFRAAPLPRQGLIFLPGPACPPALQHHPLQQMLGGPFANPLAFKARPPRPLPILALTAGGVGEGCWATGAGRRRSSALPWDALRPGAPTSLRASLSFSPAPSPLQPPQKYIVFSPNPVQLQHNKTHNKNLIHFSPAPPSPGIFWLGIKNLSSCLWHHSPDASASLMYEPGSGGPAASAVLAARRRPPVT